jgi:hypothetical protein
MPAPLSENFPDQSDFLYFLNLRAEERLFAETNLKPL